MPRTEHERISLVDLIRLCHYRWAIPTLAELGGTGGAKFVTLLKRTGAGRSALARTLDALLADDLLLRNPGYGHPMRPEWLLTPFGEVLAPACRDAIHRLGQAGLRDIAGRKWTLPVLAALAGGEETFSAMAEALPGVTPRALAQTLRSLEAAGLVRRQVEREYPPRPTYRLTETGRRAAETALSLAHAAALEED